MDEQDRPIDGHVTTGHSQACQCNGVQKSIVSSSSAVPKAMMASNTGQRSGHIRPCVGRRRDCEHSSSKDDNEHVNKQLMKTLSARTSDKIELAKDKV